MSRPMYAEFTRWNKRIGHKKDDLAAIGHEWQLWYDHTGRQCAHFNGCEANDSAAGPGSCKFGRRSKVHHVLTGPVLDFWAELDGITTDHEGKAPLRVVRVNVDARNSTSSTTTSSSSNGSSTTTGNSGSTNITSSKAPLTQRLVGLEVPERALHKVLAYIAKKGPGSAKPSLCKCSDLLRRFLLQV